MESKMIGPRFTFALASAALATSLGLVACSPAASAGRLSPMDIVAKQCVECHTDTRILEWRSKSKVAAAALVDDMIGRGAHLTAAERSTLIDYFVR